MVYLIEKIDFEKNDFEKFKSAMTKSMKNTQHAKILSSLSIIHCCEKCRGSYMSAHVRNKFNKFNNTGARNNQNVKFSLSYDIKIIVKSFFGVKMLGFCHMHKSKALFHNVSRKSVNHLWFVHFNAWR